MQIYTFIRQKIDPFVEDVAAGQKFVEHGIDGATLLGLEVLDWNDFNEIGMSRLQAKKMALKIDELRTMITANPANIWEYRATNRKYVDLMGGWLMAAPRGPLLYIRMNDYDTVWRPAFHEFGRVPVGAQSGGGALGFWLGWVLTPDLVTIFSATNFMSLHPYLGGWVIFAVGIRFAVMLGDLRELMQNFHTLKESIIGTITIVIKAESQAAMGVILWYIAWPVIPWAICDVMFYTLILFAPFRRGLIIMLPRILQICFFIYVTARSLPAEYLCGVGIIMALYFSVRVSQ